MLWREIITLGLAFLADEFGLLLALVHVMRNRPHVVEKFGINRPAAIFFPDRFSDQCRAAILDRFPQSETFAANDTVAEALVWNAALVSGLSG